MSAVTYRFDSVHQPDGWLSPGYVTVEDGRIRAVATLPPAGTAVTVVHGYAVPGMHDLHSHAFQRVLAGRTESVTGIREADDLFTWREAMYRLVDQLDPEDYEAIAAFSFAELLCGGFTTVCEFHYLHHDAGGRRYANPAEMSDRICSAAASAGIALTLLPTLYLHGGIGRDVAGPQRRFAHAGPDEFMLLIDDLCRRNAGADAPAIGIAFHSLRAVSGEEMQRVLATSLAASPDRRLHVHVSETQREVREVEAGLGLRPVQWLLDRVGLDAHWTLVHATHLDPLERAGLAASGAVAGLCPLTEATLGDGLFPLIEHHGAGGRWGIGSDSHYDAGVAAELRMLECGQRLRVGRRNVLAAPGAPLASHSGRRLFDLALSGGALASGRDADGIVAGRRADLVVLDPSSPVLLGHGPATVLDAWLLGGSGRVVRDVMVGGRWVVRDGHHCNQAEINLRFERTVRRLVA